jgi:general secretion pathway protein D
MMRVALATLLLIPLLFADGPTAAGLYEKGLKAEKAGRMAEAYLLYSQAFAEDPNNKTYWLRSQAVKSRAGFEAMPQAGSMLAAAPVAVATSGEEPQRPSLPPVTLQDRMEARQPLPPLDLDAPRDGLMDIDLRGDSRKLFEDLAHQLGLDCVFDREYQPVSSFRFKLDQVNYRDALRGLEAATSSFIVPITSRVFLVAKDTQQKRLELEPHVTVATHIDSTTVPQDFTALVTAVQQTFAIERVGFDSQTNMVIFKGPVSKVLPARAMFEDLMHPRAQVMIEVKFLEASRNDALQWGIQVPTAAAFTTGGVRTLADLARLSTSTTFLAYTAVQAALVATITKGTSRTLMDSEVQALDGQPATMHVGDKFPILTGAYNLTGQQGFAPPFTFEDLGLNLKITPLVHNSEEVSLDLEADIKALTGQSNEGIPIISHRELKSRTRLKLGDWSMVTGLMTPSETRTITGVAGLSRIPYIGSLLGVHTRDEADSVELLLIRPTLVTLPPSEYPTHRIYTGSEGRPISPL